MQDITAAKKTILDLWLFKLAVNVDQLFADGVEHDEVREILQKSRRDVGYFWRVSYAELCSRKP